MSMSKNLRNPERTNQKEQVEHIPDQMIKLGTLEKIDSHD